MEAYSRNNEMDITLSGRTNLNGGVFIRKEIEFNEEETLLSCIVKFPELKRDGLLAIFVGDFPENPVNVIEHKPCKKGQTQLEFCFRNTVPLKGKNEIILDAYYFEENAEITVNLTLKFITINDIQHLTKEVLDEAITRNWDNPYCCGLSDDTFNYMSKELYNLCQKDFPLNEPSETFLRIYVEGYPQLKIDASRKLLEISIGLNIEFWSQAIADKPYAKAFIMFIVDVEPAAITTSYEGLGLLISDIKYDSNDIEPDIVNSEELLRQFGTESNFRMKYNSIIQEIVDKNPDADVTDDTTLNMILPSVVSTISPVEEWPTIDGCRSIFKGFVYKSGNIEDRKVGFLFIVFSIYSLEVCSPCICTDDNLQSNSLKVDFNRGLGGNFEKVYKSGEVCLDRCGTIGISQDALKEILHPMLNQASEKKEVRKNDLFRAELNFWNQVFLENVQFTNTGIDVNLKKIEAGAEVTVKARGEVGRAAKGSISFLVRARDVKIDLNLSTLYYEFWPSITTAIRIRPSVSIGSLEPELSGTHIPYPVDEMINEVLRLFGDSIKPWLELFLNTAYSLSIFKLHSIVNFPDERDRYMFVIGKDGIEFKSNECMIVKYYLYSVPH